MRDIILVAHNIRSTHNVGSLIRTVDGIDAGLYLTGYTPYPSLGNSDKRLPHTVAKLDRQIQKTALGAEVTAQWSYHDDVQAMLSELKTNGYLIVALEQVNTSISLPTFKPPQKIALLIGREREGIEPEILPLCDQFVEIPMLGEKESYNVVQAAAMALFYLRFVT